jgi:hypothetical protein
MQLNSVVLPAPLGPINAQMSPCATSKLTPVESDDAAEAHRHTLYPQQGGAAVSCHPDGPLVGVGENSGSPPPTTGFSA